MKDENLEMAFLNFYTAAEFGHREGRAYLGIFYENGIFPNSHTLEKHLKAGADFEFLTLLSDLREDLLKFEAGANYTLFDFKQEMPSKALINYYLSTM